MAGIKVAYIYGLFDPRNHELRYVGKSNCPQRRYAQHMEDARLSTRRPLWAWIRSLLKLGLSPDLEVLDEVGPDEWEEAERAWIADARREGRDLLNVALGGEGCSVRHTLFGCGFRRRYESRKRRALPGAQARLAKVRWKT